MGFFFLFFFLVEEEREYKYIEALTKIKKGNVPLCLLMSLFMLLYIWKESSMKIQWDFEVQQKKKKKCNNIRQGFIVGKKRKEM